MDQFPLQFFHLHLILRSLRSTLDWALGIGNVIHGYWYVMENFNRQRWWRLFMTCSKYLETWFRFSLSFGFFFFLNFISRHEFVYRLFFSLLAIDCLPIIFLYIVAFFLSSSLTQQSKWSIFHWLSATISFPSSIQRSDSLIKCEIN